MTPVQFEHGTYIGSLRLDLANETALFWKCDEDHVMAQFDNLALVESRGWHQFFAYEFQAD